MGDNAGAIPADTAPAAPLRRLQKRAAELSSRHSAAQLNGRRSVVLVGPPRVGKSIIAQELQELHGYRLIAIDSERWRFLQQDSKEAWQQFRADFILTLLENLKSGVILEGDDILAIFLEASETLHMEELKSLLSDICLVFIGSARENYEEKGKSIIEYRENNECWTNEARPDEESVFKLAKYIIKISKESIKTSNLYDGKYFGICSSCFEKDIKRVVRYISIATG